MMRPGMMLAPLRWASRRLTPAECRRLGAHLVFWELVLLILVALS